MYAKIKDSAVVKYPYSTQELYEDNPSVGFPPHLTAEVLAPFNTVIVVHTGQLEVDHTQNVSEGTPVFVTERNRWEQTWVVTPATDAEIAHRVAAQAAQIEAQRLEAYRTESDPLFFKAQRGEATQQQWLDKIAEIKLRYTL
jgi:hypothetical protein